MDESGALFLAARSGGLHLAVPVNLLREVVESPSARWLAGDVRHGGAVEWCGEELAVCQPAQLQGWGDAFRAAGHHLLILDVSGRRCGLLVDDIVGIFPAEGFILHPMPKALVVPGMCYDRLAVRDERVMIVCDQTFVAGLVERPGAE